MESVNSYIYQLCNAKELKVVEQNLALESENQIIAQTFYSALSPGTELSAWLGKPPLRPSKVYPRLQGYCNLARVIKVGSQVSNVKIDDWILTHQSHRSHFCIDESEVLVSYQSLTSQQAKNVVSTYLYHLGYSALIKANYFPGHKVAILGFGALGYTTASLVTAFGGNPLVITSDVSRIANFNLANVDAISKECESIALEENKFDIVINTSDSWDDYLKGLKLLRYGGEMVLLGFPGRGLASPTFNPLDSSLLYDKQLSLKYAGYVCESEQSEVDVRFTLKRNMAYISGLLLNERVNVDALNSNITDWKNLDELYKSLNERSIKELGGILSWS